MTEENEYLKGAKVGAKAVLGLAIIKAVLAVFGVRI